MLLMVTDNSTFRTRDKNAVLIDRRILRQNVKGGKYVSVELEHSRGKHIFRAGGGGGTVLCMVRIAMSENENTERTINVLPPLSMSRCSVGLAKGSGAMEQSVPHSECNG